MDEIKNFLDTKYADILNKYKDNKNARLLLAQEIIDASEDMQVDFESFSLIPVFDIFDNDFICFQIKNGKWCVFNIVDEISFKTDKTLEELLLLKS